jgi:hypothetical protein
MDTATGPSGREDRGHVVGGIRADARLVAAAVAAGGVVGLVLAGLGGRLAMRVMTLTSEPAVLGMLTDDGFVVGEFDLWRSSRFILEEGIGTGLLAALSWLAIRPFLGGPRWARHLVHASTFGLFFGATAVHPGGVDFTALGPVWLALLLFGLGPAVVFLIASLALERLAGPDGWFRTAPERRALLPLLAFLVGPFLLPMLVVAILVSAVRHSVRGSPALLWLRTCRPGPRWTAWIGLACLFALSASKLIRDTVTLLGTGS